MKVFNNPKTVTGTQGLMLINLKSYGYDESQMRK